jgi:hypothetical protein
VDAEIIRLISSLLGEPLVIANEQSDASQPAMELVRHPPIHGRNPAEGGFPVYRATGMARRLSRDCSKR